MNEPRELRNLVRQLMIDGYSSFDSWSICQQIVFLGWFFHRVCSKETFTEEDIYHTLNDLDIPIPASFGHEEIMRCPEMVQAPSIPVQVSPNRTVPRISYRVKHLAHDQLDRQYLPIYNKINVPSPPTTEAQIILSELPAKIPIIEEREYLEETLKCLDAKANRAAIVMCWNLVYYHLCNYILKDSNRRTALNQELQKVPKAKLINTYDDFSRHQEGAILDACNTANLISKNQHSILVDKLKQRNMAAHPSTVVINTIDTQQYISSLVHNLVLPLHIP